MDISGGNNANDVIAPYYGLSREVLLKILDNISNEVYVLDKNLDILYVSKSSFENYGLHPDQMIGHNHNDFSGKYWIPSVIPLVVTEKRRGSVEIFTITGKNFINMTVPVFDEQGDLKMIVAILQKESEIFDSAIDQETHELSSRINIMSRSREMELLMKKCNKAAKTDAPVLIQGESGTGKSILAKYIHQNSLRYNGPFLSINCASIPENLLESELFGYEAYAFTGASAKGKPGLIELADNGTLFLDEVGELTISSQAKLLNVIENNQFIPVGSCTTKKVNVRIISATNKNLLELVEKKNFREDLFWRLNIIDMELPPLASRKEDIVLWATYFLNLYNTKYGQQKTFSPEVIQVFLNYQWPGNIRQLKNEIERAFIMSQRQEILVSDLNSALIPEEMSQFQQASDLKSRFEEYERVYISKMYAKYKNSRNMGDALKVCHSTANCLINKYCRSADD